MSLFEFLRNILFPVHLFNQIKTQTFLEISANFHDDDWGWHDCVNVLSLATQSLSKPWKFFISDPSVKKTNLLNDFIQLQSFNNLSP